MVAAAVLIYTAIATITVVAPVVAYLIIGAPVRAVLEPVRTWLVRYYNVIIAAVLAIIGAVMIGKGLAGFRCRPYQRGTPVVRQCAGESRALSREMYNGAWHPPSTV